MLDALLEILTEFWSVLAEMAPWLVIGFALAGVLWVFVKPAWVARHLSAEDGRGKWAVIKASLMGVPLPLCSCGVIPVGTSLHKQGASKGASASFLISTPQTGVDSILATYALMGPVYAVVRPAVALASGVLGGWLVDLVERRETREAHPAEKAAETGGCASSCCGFSTEAAGVTSWWGKAKAAARYGFVTLPADLVGSLFVGLLLAAVLTTLLGGDALATWFGGAWGVGFAVLIGIPIYVCSTGSIPIAV
ncbi:MAG: permease, partial [Planctomycetota bacterium]